MVIITKTIMKYNWYFSWCIIHKIAYFMSSTSIFSSIMTMISYFNIIIFSIFKKWFFTYKAIFVSIMLIFFVWFLVLIQSFIFFQNQLLILLISLNLNKIFLSNLYLYNNPIYYFFDQMNSQ